jgi:hypothetical protein
MIFGKARQNELNVTTKISYQDSAAVMIPGEDGKIRRLLLNIITQWVCLSG